MQLNPAAADEIVGSQRIAIPDCHVHLPEALDERNLELLLEGGIPAAICTGACAEFGVSILNADVWILAREQLGVP